jgi:hypothetical protein
LKLKVAEIGPDGRSVDDLLVAALIQEAFAGRNRMAALAYIFDRLEGRPRQAVDLKSVSEDLATRSENELEYYVAHGRWPGDTNAEIEAGERQAGNVATSCECESERDKTSRVLSASNRECGSAQRKVCS